MSAMDPKIIAPACFTQMETDLAFELGRREGQVHFLREQISRVQAELVGRKPGGQRLAISGAIAITSRTLAMTEAWEAPKK